MTMKTTTFSLFFILFLVSIDCYGSSGAGGHGGGSSWMSFFWSVVNFLILVAILYIFGRKPVANFLNSRKKEIEDTLNKAKEAHRETKQALNELEMRLKDKDKEIAEIVEAARKAGELERDAAIEEGKKRKANILDQTKTQLEYEFKKAKDSIKTEIVLASLELAEKELSKVLTKEKKEKLIMVNLKKMQDRN